MAHDPDEVGRYDPRSEDPRVRLGARGCGIFWIGGLLIMLLVALGSSLGILWLLGSSGVPVLKRWGVIAPYERIVAVHDLSAARDGSAGCAITGRRIVRWDQREPVASVPLPGAEVEVDPDGVRVRNGDEVVDCPFAEGEDPTAFAAMARRWAARPPRSRSPD